MIAKARMVIILGLIITAGIFLAGCTQQPASVPATTVVTTAPPATMGAASMANPASVNCGAVGGQTEIKKSADGSEYGMCSFPNGTSCEEWALFRNEGCKAFTPVTTTAPAIGLANPASVNCGKVGGNTEIKKNADGSEYGMCAFQNGTSCEEWALFRGEGCMKGNATAKPS